MLKWKWTDCQGLPLIMDVDFTMLTWAKKCANNADFSCLFFWPALSYLRVQLYISTLVELHIDDCSKSVLKVINFIKRRK